MFSYGAIWGQDKSSIVRTIKKKRAIQVVVWLIIGILRSFDSLHVVVYSCRQHVLIFNAFSEMKRNFESLKLAPSLFFFFVKKRNLTYMWIFSCSSLFKMWSHRNLHFLLAFLQFATWFTLLWWHPSTVAHHKHLTSAVKKKKNFQDLLSYVQGLRWIMFN